MKYRWPRQVMSEELAELAKREVARQKMDISIASKTQMQEIAAVKQAIKKEGMPNYLICKKLTPELGHGIFLLPTAKALVKGRIIAPYAGKVFLAPVNQDDESSYAFDLLSDITLTKEEHVLFDRERAFHPRRLYSMVLDASKNGNFTRFINHSEKPNVTACYLTIPKNRLGLEPSPLEIIYIAKKTILPGEQLLVSYEDEAKSYWGPLKIKPFPMTPQTFRLDHSLHLNRQK